MEDRERRQVLEALLLAAAEPVTAQRLAGVLGDSSASEVRDAVAALNDEYAESGRGFRIEAIAGGFQLRTLPELAPWLQRLRPQPPLRLSRAALETLAIIAYRQPITRAELEQVRGVDVGAVVTSLVERKLVRIAGHREVPGRPMLYATTPRFLEIFGLAALSDLPTLREIEELLREHAAQADVSPGVTDAEGCDGDDVPVSREPGSAEADEQPAAVALGAEAELDLEPPITTH